MAEIGAQPGNQNAKHSRRWQQAIFRALARASNKDIDSGMDRMADKVVSKAMGGDKWAIDHIADRSDGKVPQGVTLGGDSDNPLQTRHVVEYVSTSKHLTNGASATAGETEATSGTRAL